MSGRSDWYSFGRGEHGELGRMVVTDGVETPGIQNADVRPLALPTQDGVELELRSVYCGHFHCLARSSAGRIWAWGANGEGQLGIAGELGDDVFVSAPTEALGSMVEELQQKDPGERIVSAAGGRSHSVFVSACGRCFAAGRLPASEPGRQDAAHSQAEELREIELVDGCNNQPQGRVISCHAGESHTLFCTDTGEVWSWLGENLRATRAGVERPTARPVLGLPKVVQISCGWHHTIVLTDTRKVFSFGVGCFGQLGLGSCRNCTSPSHVSLPEECDGNVVNVAAGFATSFAVTSHGWVYAWGSNEKCQLALGSSVRGTATPKPVDALSRVRIVQVSAGFAHSAAITVDGLLYLWGSGSYGQMGFGFDDTKASLCLDGGGCATFAGGFSVQGTSNCPGGVGNPGANAVGHSRPWIQVWPRRCTRGPFSRLTCCEVRCGAYHTLARISDSPLEPVTLSEPDVLEPPPLFRTDPQGSGHYGPADAGSEQGTTSGSNDNELAALSHLSDKDVLRNGDKTISRSTSVFHMLSGQFWSANPLKCLAPLTAPQPSRTLPAQQEGGWRRALVQTSPQHKLVIGTATGESFKSPLMLKQVQDNPSHKLEASGELLRLPVDGGGALGPTTWDAVDEAVHRGFCQGFSTAKPDLAALLKEASRKGAAGFSPELPDGEMRRGLPPAPCRGLARIECLTPRPFYVQHGQGKTEKQPQSHPKKPESRQTIATPSAVKLQPGLTSTTPRTSSAPGRHRATIGTPSSGACDAAESSNLSTAEDADSGAASASGSVARSSAFEGEDDANNANTVGSYPLI